MSWIKKLFCRHQWRAVQKRTSNHCDDCIYFSDLGFWDDIKYKCEKCGKEKIKTIANSKHPLLHEWEDLNDKDR